VLQKGWPLSVPIPITRLHPGITLLGLLSAPSKPHILTSPSQSLRPHLLPAFPRGARGPATGFRPPPVGRPLYTAARHLPVVGLPRPRHIGTAFTVAPAAVCFCARSLLRRRSSHCRASATSQSAVRPNAARALASGRWPGRRFKTDQWDASTVMRLEGEPKGLVA
jgi:hypothetical protein